VQLVYSHRDVQIDIEIRPYTYNDICIGYILHVMSKCVFFKHRRAGYKRPVLMVCHKRPKNHRLFSALFQGQMSILLLNRGEIYRMVIEICKNVCTLCPLYRPDQGNIVGREYINFYKFLLPYGISLSDSTIAPASGRRRTYYVYTILKLADHALFNVLLRPLRPELDGRPSSANYSDSSTKL
jgi:hypothetical protein